MIKFEKTNFKPEIDRFRLKHDLYNMWEELCSVKGDPKRTTAKNTLWIDEIIKQLKKMEESF